MKNLLQEFHKLWKEITEESAGISLTAGFLPQSGRQREQHDWQGAQSPREDRGEMRMKVGFICNAGLGSSAMGATLFRRKLQEMGIAGVDVKAYPADEVPGDLILAVCQKDFMEMTGIALKTENVYIVENLLDQSEYAALAEAITEIMREG